MLTFTFLVFSFVSFGHTLDLLGLQISVPALEQNGGLANVLTGSGSTKAVTTTPVPTAAPLRCRKSPTKINGGQTVCGNTLLFEDKFAGGILNTTNWMKEQYIPREPDYEFVSYETRAQNCYIQGGKLFLKATMREDPFISQLDLNKGCTGKICSSNTVGTILPPIVAGRVKTKFSFLYGKIEIRAQLPRGDWLFPQLYLEPKGYTYGDGYQSGRMWVAYARGNRDLQRKDTGEQIGNSVLYGGAVLSASEPERTHSANSISSSEDSWGDEFHVYSLVWSPGGISVVVDGVEQGFISPPFSTSGVPYSHLWTSNMAPFDREFVVTLGVGAGGHSDFPDGSSSDGNVKPWKKTNSKATTLFYNAKDKWLPTWEGDNSALKIDYVRVWSL